eukprot:4142637-Prymnesium_polylepis.2
MLPLPASDPLLLDGDWPRGGPARLDVSRAVGAVDAREPHEALGPRLRLAQRPHHRRVASHQQGGFARHLPDEDVARPPRGRAPEATGAAAARARARDAGPVAARGLPGRSARQRCRHRR